MFHSAPRAISNISYEVLWNNRGRIIQLYPETARGFLTPISGTCGACKKKRIARSILSIIQESPKRDISLLRGVFPQEVLKWLAIE